MKKKLKTEVIGYISVDSGLVFLGDPGYHSDGRSPFHDWEKFNKQYERDMNEDEVVIAENGSHIGAGLVFKTLGGDGVYEVKVKKDETGKIVSIYMSLK